MNDYNYQNNSYSVEPDYYDLYTEGKLKEARGVFSRYHLGLLFYTVAAYVAVIALEVILALVMDPDALAKLFDNIYFQWAFSMAPMYLIGFPVLILIVRNMKTLPREKKSMKAGEFFLLFLISQGVMFVGNMIGNTLNGVISSILGHEITNSTSELIEATPIWFVFLVVVVIGPIIEELMFRKLMIDRLGRYGDAVAIIVSAVSFGLFHGNFYQFFYAAMLGFVLGYIYTKTGNVKYTILMHMIINFFGSVLVMPIIEMAAEIEEMSVILNEGGKVDMLKFVQNAMAVGTYTIVDYALVFAGIAVLITYITGKKIKLSGTCEYKIPKERVAGTVILNVGTILFLVMSLALFAVSIFAV